MTNTNEIAVSEENASLEIDDMLPMEPSKAAQMLLYVIVGLVVLTLVWASVARLDQVTRGRGWVVTSNSLQEVQYLEGGIVKEILVSAGERVKAGQLLVKLDPTQMNAEFSKGRAEFNALSARITRLESESSLEPLRFSEAFVAAAPEIVSRERALYNARADELSSALEIAQKKSDQRQRTFEDAKVAFETAKEAFALADQELKIVRKLADKGIEPRVELIRAQQREATARGEMQRAEIAVSRAELEAQEADGEVERVRTTFAAKAAEDLNTARAEYASLKGELPALEDKVARTDVRAPVAGVVNRVLVSTLGGVVSPGETIVEIVPSEDTLLVEARIKPADIGFLSIGQEAKVSITAFDSTVYGSLDGAIETISPDAIEDEKTGDRYYNVRVRTTAEALEGKRKNLRIIPGMAADVAILNGKRSVLAYIMRPLSRVRDNALRE